MSKVIVITSGKGGVGKTTSTANIGAGLAQMNKKVILVDTDIGLRNLDVVMGLENRIIYNLVDVIEGNCRIRQALIRDKHYPSLYLLPSAQTRDKSAVSPEQMIKLVDGLKPLFDYILLDCPAGIEQGFRNAIAAADQAVVVTTPEVSAIRDADRIIGLLEADGIKKIDLILILAVNLLGAVPDEESVVIAANHGESLIGSNTLAGQAFFNIARRLDGETVPLLDLQTSTSLFQKIASVFKGRQSQ